MKFQAIATTSDTSAVDDSLDAGGTYVYRFATNADSDSQVSAPVKFLPCRASAALDGFGDSPQSILLEWRDAVGETAYRIERSDDGEHFDVVGSVPANASGYRNSGVEPGKRYFYRVATVISSGHDSLSKPVRALSGVADLSATLPAIVWLISWRPDHPIFAIVRRTHRQG